MVVKKHIPKVVIVNRCIVRNDKGEILLIKRSKNDPFNPGLWEVPGGKLEDGEVLAFAMEKEVLDETGLFVKLDNLAVFADTALGRVREYKGITYVTLTGVGMLIGGKVKLSKEHTDYKWASLSQAFDMEITPEAQKALAALVKE